MLGSFLHSVCRETFHTLRTARFTRHHGSRQQKEKVMKLASIRGFRTLSHGVWVAALALTMMASGTRPAAAQDDSARKILKTMSDYVAGQKSISTTFDSDIEVISTSLQKIQYTNSGQLQMVRPDKLRTSRSGGYTDVDLVFDGTTVRIHGRHNNIFAEVNATGTIDQLVDRLRDGLHVSIPGADLLLASGYDRLTEDVLEAKHIGQGVIDGVECEHLAFRTPETDWQIWIESGARPIPRKYVITSKTIAGAPQYTLRIKSWSTDALAADVFAFKVASGAKKVDAKDLQDIDEVPSGLVAGGGK
jgi:hypothetical protein